MVLDSKKSWSNLPFALMPASVGVCLLMYPWLGGFDPSMTAPIMVPFGLVWLLIAACINGYYSELILDPQEQSVAYRSCLVLHSWSNSVARGNVRRVVLDKDHSRYRFVMEVEEGEDLSVTTFDYWRAREWSERVSTFLQVPLVDECRSEREVSPEELAQSLLDKCPKEEFSAEPPGKIELERAGKTSKISIPPRGFLRSAFPRLILGLMLLLAGAASPFFFSSGGWLFALAGLGAAIWACYRPVAQATHREVIEVGAMLRVKRAAQKRHSQHRRYIQERQQHHHRRPHCVHAAQGAREHVGKRI